MHPAEKVCRALAVGINTLDFPRPLPFASHPGEGMLVPTWRCSWHLETLITHTRHACHRVKCNWTKFVRCLCSHACLYWHCGSVIGSFFACDWSHYTRDWRHYCWAAYAIFSMLYVCYTRFLTSECDPWISRCLYCFAMQVGLSRQKPHSSMTVPYFCWEDVITGELKVSFVHLRQKQATNMW